MDRNLGLFFQATACGMFKSVITASVKKTASHGESRSRSNNFRRTMYNIHCELHKVSNKHL